MLYDEVLLNYLLVLPDLLHGAVVLDDSLFEDVAAICHALAAHSLGFADSQRLKMQQL